MFDNVWLIPLFPLIGFLINGLFGKMIKEEKVIGGIGSIAVLGSFIVSSMTLMKMISLPARRGFIMSTFSLGLNQVISKRM